MTVNLNQPTNFSNFSAQHNLTRYFSKLVKFFLKNGLRSKQHSTILYTFSQIYTYFFNKFWDKGSNYSTYLNIKEFYFILTSSKNLNNISSIIKWVVSLNHSQFDISIQKIPKKYKKKYKKKYIYKIKYLNKRKQVNNVLRWVYLTTHNFNTYGLKKRFFLNSLDLLLNFKKSNLFLKKIIIYKNFLKI